MDKTRKGGSKNGNNYRRKKISKKNKRKLEN